MKHFLWLLWGIYDKLPRFLKAIISRVFFCPRLGKDVHLFGWVVFSKNVEIGDYTFVNSNRFIGNVSIGKFCCIAEGLCVGLDQHPYEQFSSYRMFASPCSPLRNYKEKQLFVEKEIERTYIGNDVWIGHNVTIKDGVTIGDGAVIGASAVVTRDVPAFAVAAGVPAKVIKYRFDEEKIKLLQTIKWWDWTPEKIYDHLEQLCEFDTSLLDLI